MSNTKRNQYIDTIAAKGHKITKDQVIHAWPIHPHGTSEYPVPPGQTRPDHVWVEHGGEKSGLYHFTYKHGKDYKNIGVPPEKQEKRLPQYMEASTTVGRHIGYASKKEGRPVMSTYFKDEQRVVRNSVTVANNGYVVGMDPLAKETVRRRPGDPQEVSDRTMKNLYYYPPNVPARRSTYAAQASQPHQSQAPYKHPTNKW
ncbi:hypothetical protein PG997_009219 [Apiospora hydei]|uniref:Uncharacterized protein n=1 Tax=Apiospora hydei TaxID=1337664 RepID=A0ABR1VW53_9PEZI